MTCAIRQADIHSGTPIEIASRSRPPPKPMDRLPQISYGLMKDQALRKKLAELGIPNSGPRLLLTKRHTEWVNLVNSNCDSTRPRTKRELLGELDTWERSQGRNILNGLSGGETNSVMRKDFDGAAWANIHGSDFQQLIAKARQKSKSKQEDRSSADQDGAGRNHETRATTSDPAPVTDGTPSPSSKSGSLRARGAPQPNGTLSEDLGSGSMPEIIDLDNDH